MAENSRLAHTVLEKSDSSSISLGIRPMGIQQQAWALLHAYGSGDSLRKWSVNLQKHRKVQFYQHQISNTTKSGSDNNMSDQAKK